MPTAPLLRVVIDTNIVFEGLTKQGGAAGLIIDAWLAGLLEIFVSNALAYEYEDVLSRKLSETRWQTLQPVLGVTMSQLTLRLPKTLHQQLIGLAKSEGISLNQYIVYALTRQVALAYSIQPMSSEALVEQEQAFAVLLHKLGQASPTEISSVLAEREVVEPEEELSSGIITRLQQRISESTKI